MTILRFFLFILASCSVASSASADKYAGTDNNGLKQYINQGPLSGSRLLMIIKEKPNDEAADHARMEAEKQEPPAPDLLKIAQVEGEPDLDFNRWYYRNGRRQSTPSDKLVHRTPYPSYPYIKKPYSSDRKPHHNRYRGQVRPRPNTRYRPKGHFPTYNMNPGSTNNYNVYRGSGTGSRNGISNGRGSFSRGRSGFGMHR